MVVAVSCLLANAVCVCGCGGREVESSECEHDEDVLVLIGCEKGGVMWSTVEIYERDVWYVVDEVPGYVRMR